MTLPTHSSAVEEKLERQQRANASLSSWTRPVSLSIPGVRSRRLRILLPNALASPFNNLTMSSSSSRTRRKRGPAFVIIVCLAVCLGFVLLTKSILRRSRPVNWDTLSGQSSTLVFKREDLQKIWKWEIESGHYPSRESLPMKLSFTQQINNPAIPRQPTTRKPSRYRPPGSVDVVTESRGRGAKRIYLDIQSHPPNVAYPPRPVAGGVADMDHIMAHCDFGRGKYVRDCLEMLRLGGGLDNGDRFRRDPAFLDYRFMYLEQSTNHTTAMDEDDDEDDQASFPLYPKQFNRIRKDDEEGEAQSGLVKKKGVEWEEPLDLPPPTRYSPTGSLTNPCDPANPRIFHMFWTGPFTDKPYMALLSYLFTQNTGIHLKDWPADSKVCRPQFWLWLNPGPAAAVPNPNAMRDMYAQLKSSPWASPFLHPRFKDVIQFKLWNTTEQLDGIPEIKEEWRALSDSLFNSGGFVISVKKKKGASTTEATLNTTSALPSTKSNEDDDDILNRLGSKSSSSYDRLSVILSDMARFVLTHRFGGIYLDADTIFLRDWEELWGWTGAFAYRWSRLEDYNTAVLKMSKNSALGSFIFRTALKNGLDFHPMTIGRYMRDSHLQGLLLRLPDALFDAAWLNTEEYQRDRPPQPYFTEFLQFFDTPAQTSAAPQALGFHGFFRGSYSYHFHNFWWKPFDSSRNFPDLGTRFKVGEELAHSQLRKEKMKELLAAKARTRTQTVVPVVAAVTERERGREREHDDDDEDVSTMYSSSASDGDGEELLKTIGPDKQDLDWSTVLKRTFEGYIRGERPNMYGEWIEW